MLCFLSAVVGKSFGQMLEVGTHRGAGAVAMAMGAPLSFVDTVDTNVDAACAGQLERFGVSDRVHRHLGDSRDVLPMLAGTEYDLALIDACHDWEIKGKDVAFAIEHATLIVIDDCAWQSDYWMQFLNMPGFQILPTTPETIESQSWMGVRAAYDECFPGNVNGAWQNGVCINPDARPKFGVVLNTKRI